MARKSAQGVQGKIVFVSQAKNIPPPQIKVQSRITSVPLLLAP